MDIVHLCDICKNEYPLKMISDGKIILYFGPMHSGKSGKLNRKLKKLSIFPGNKVIKYRYYKNENQKDERYPLDQSHDGITPPENMEVMNCSKLDSLWVPSLVEKGINIIGIDEAQFFENLSEFCDAAQRVGIKIYVAALNGTFERKSWPEIDKLIPYVHTIIKLNAVCKVCGKDAPYSKRINKSKDLIQIGNDYESVCLIHFNQ